MNLITSKLWESHSRLYRPGFLQNTRWKALDEIYKIYLLLHHLGLNISAKSHRNVADFSQNFQILQFWIFCSILVKICRKFSRNLGIWNRPAAILFQIPRELGIWERPGISEFESNLGELGIGNCGARVSRTWVGKRSRDFRLLACIDPDRSDRRIIRLMPF